MFYFLIALSFSKYLICLEAPDNNNDYKFGGRYSKGGTYSYGTINGRKPIQLDDSKIDYVVNVTSKTCTNRDIKTFHAEEMEECTTYQNLVDLLPNECKASGGGGDEPDSGNCQEGGKVYLITGSSVTIQGNDQKCPNAETLRIDANIITLQGDCFKGRAFKTVEIKGKSLTIQSGAFKDCKSLTSVTATLSSTFTAQGAVFRGCENLESVTLTSRTSTIQGDGMFCDCSKMSDSKINANPQPTIQGDIYKCPKDGSSSGGDSDSGLSARTLGNFEIKSAFLGTTPNIIVNLNFFYSFMRTIRKNIGRVVPSPEIVHSAIWVGEANPTDESMGALFTYGRYFNKNNNQAFLWNDGAKGYAISFKDFKLKFNAANPMKLNLKKNIKLLDFIDSIQSSGNWKAKDYNWPTNNCQHFTAKLINILGASRVSPSNEDWVDVPKLVLNSLESNEEN
ncbi:hypothetical protein M9Y10_029852 [Tritrichomonas musculus]|uniref:Uncharacterized protein n=1 Tax=Tritrichomonas musculus TaxID=1915356 RepID=A0ABR2KN75_9EUKA